MEKLRASSPVVSLIGLLLVGLLFWGCDNTSDIKSIDNAGSKLLFSQKEFPISKFNLITGALDITTNSEGAIYISNIFTRSIYKSSPPFTEYGTIGHNGNGPGEYITPARLFLEKNYLFYSDIRNGLIKKISLNENTSQLDSIDDISLESGGGNKFALDGKYIYVLNKTSPLISVYSRSSGKKLQSTLSINEKYLFPLEKLNGGDIFINDVGDLFVIPTLPPILYKLTFRNDSLSITNQWDLSVLEPALEKVLNWDDRILSRFKNLQDPTEMQKKLESLTVVKGLSRLEKDDKAYYIIHLKNSNEEVNYYLVINEEGEKLEFLQSKRNHLLYTREDKLYFYDQLGNIPECDTCSVIYEYSFNPL